MISPIRLFAAALGTALLVLAPLQADEAPPVTPDAIPEAKALLHLLHSLSGNHILTGQHNYPNIKDRNTEFAAQYTGKTPVIFGSDWGHAMAGNSDSYLARPDIVQEAIRQHQRGAIVALCWHEVPPTADEPITFAQLPGSDPKKLTSVQGQLLDEQFKDVLTPGTPLYEHWCAQVDAIAGFLKQLEAAHVPVLWRPYHEMNGNWFWWGGRTGTYSTIALYRQMFDRFVHHHHLRNLVWVWSVDRVSRPGMEHEKFFPGIDFVDVLALDVYGNDFAQSYYDSLVALSQGKPLALAEVGNPPALEVLDRQPRWTYYMTWAGMVRNASRRQYAQLYADPRVLNLEDPAYAAITAPYREACGLPPLHFVRPPANFTGTWVLDEDRSDFGGTGPASAPVRLEIVQQGASLRVRSTRELEFADDRVSDESLTLDGSEVNSTFMNSPRTTTATLSPDGQQVTVNQTITFAWGPPGAKAVSKETWELAESGRRLVIHRETTSPRGTQKQVLVLDRS
ncbi:MAG TPA: glycosyl hydrolase [Candidatus Didemnitutus sp.]|jgi:mannan endo-1,4-beta-mannosidase